MWDVNTNTFSVYLDGNLRLSTVIPNIVNTYFGGNPIVNWGWSAATGGGTNDQRVCIESISSWVAGVNYQSCAPTMQFSDISASNVGSIQSWAWTFGDGGTSTQQNPSHTYPGVGTYNVSLTITDISNCTKVSCKLFLGRVMGFLRPNVSLPHKILPINASPLPNIALVEALHKIIPCLFIKPPSVFSTTDGVSYPLPVNVMGFGSELHSHLGISCVYIQPRS